MDLRRYSSWHDEVLRPIAAFVKVHLQQISLTPSTQFPHHITPTTLRPDLVWWSDADHVLWLLELTVSFEAAMEEAWQRKQAKYQDLVNEATEAGYSTELITLEVGSRGMIDESELVTLQAALDTTTKKYHLGKPHRQSCTTGVLQDLVLEKLVPVTL